jgi:hypothetical protein
MCRAVFGAELVQGRGIDGFQDLSHEILRDDADICLVACFTLALSRSVSSDALLGAYGRQPPLALQAELGHTTNSGASEAEWGRCMRCGQIPCTFTCGVTLPESPLL